MQKQPEANTPAWSWDDVRYFLEVARAGSLSGAARALRVEHSTVARRVDALEQALGLRLFDRYARGWSLTTEGDALAAQARRLEDEAQAFSRAALGAATLRGTVRISAPPVFTSHFLVPRLAARRAQWQALDLELVGESREANLSRGEADVALRLSRPTAPGLVARRIGEMRYGLYGAPSHLTRAPEDWEFLGYDESLARVPQQRWLEQVAAGRPMTLRCNDLASLAAAARAGLGLAALPHFLAVNDPDLRPLPAQPCPDGRPLWLVMHPDVRRSPRVRLVADLLTTLVDEARDLLLGTPPGTDGVTPTTSSGDSSPADADY